MLNALCLDEQVNIIDRLIDDMSYHYKINDLYKMPDKIALMFVKSFDVESIDISEC